MSMPTSMVVVTASKSINFAFSSSLRWSIEDDPSKAPLSFCRIVRLSSKFLAADAEWRFTALYPFTQEIPLSNLSDLSSRWVLQTLETSRTDTLPRCR